MHVEPGHVYLRPASPVGELDGDQEPRGDAVVPRGGRPLGHVLQDILERIAPVHALPQSHHDGVGRLFEDRALDPAVVDLVGEGSGGGE